MRDRRGSVARQSSTGRSRGWRIVFGFPKVPFQAESSEGTSGCRRFVDGSGSTAARAALSGSLNQHRVHAQRTRHRRTAAQVFQRPVSARIRTKPPRVCQRLRVSGVAGMECFVALHPVLGHLQTPGMHHRAALGRTGAGIRPVERFTVPTSSPSARAHPQPAFISSSLGSPAQTRRQYIRVFFLAASFSFVLLSVSGTRTKMPSRCLFRPSASNCACGCPARYQAAKLTVTKH